MSRAASPSAYQVSLPYNNQYRVGDIAYEILAATVRPDADGQLALVLSLRARSYSDYDYNFWDTNFQVNVGPDIYPASGGLDDLLRAHATQNGDLLFVIPDSARQATLKIRFPDDRQRSIPIEIQPATG